MDTDVNPEVVELALFAWLTELADLKDLFAEEAETDDPTVGDAVREQLEACVGLAAEVIDLLGKQALVNAGKAPDYVKPPF